MSADLTYASYLHLDEILNAQVLLSGEPEHDEMLFIVIHQVYELWFKQMLHETDHAKRLLYAGDASSVMKTIKRVLKILKTVVAQIDVLETMSPLEFSAFRRYLASSSGFQSYQFRELEFVLGHKRQNMVIHFSEGSTGRANIERRYEESTLWDAFLAYLSEQGYELPSAVNERDVTQPIEPNEAVQDVLVNIYHSDPLSEMLCELLVDLDEGVQEWRYRHVKMVERTIGTKHGTGGSAGVAYLQTTLKPFFPDLWVIRSRL